MKETKYRIFQETRKDGTVFYTVERKRKFLWFKPEWVLECVDVGVPYRFQTLEEAQIHCGINPNPVVKSKEFINIFDKKGEPIFIGDTVVLDDGSIGTVERPSNNETPMIYIIKDGLGSHSYATYRDPIRETFVKKIFNNTAINKNKENGTKNIS